MPHDQSLGVIPIESSNHLEVEAESATVKSAKRVLQILELFKEMRRPLTTTDIAMALNYPISSTAALLKSLASLGYLHFDRNMRTYEASLRVGLLGAWSYNDGFAPETLNAVIDRMARETGQTVIVGLRNENCIQYVSIVTRNASVRYYLPIGSRQRLVDTTMGRALLSFDEDHAIDRLVRRANADRSEKQPRIDATKLREEITQIRAMGYAYSNQGFFKGAGVVAVTLPLSGSEPRLALAVGGPSDEIEQDRGRLINVVLSSAREITSRHDARKDAPSGETVTHEPILA